MSRYTRSAVLVTSPAPVASLALWASAQPGKENGSPGWGLGTMLLVSALVVLLLTALVMALFLLRRRRDSHGD